MRSNHFLLNNSITALGQWLALALLIAVLTGTASALFLFSHDWATTTRVNHHWLIWLLPVAGFIVGWIYLLYGSAVEGGNNLVLDEIHHPHSIIRLRMAPLVFISTVISHLFGASVGREGTAVQMGASIADQFTRLFRLTPDSRRLVLMAGISAGFSSVFGTPLAGAIFGLAGMGFVAVFAGAANTPVASTLMAIELFGSETGIYAALACAVAWLISGYTGIYRSQRVACPKHGFVPENIKLADIPHFLAANTRKQD